MNKEELNQKVLFWHPELTIAECGGYTLVLEVDAFNNHMCWNVEWNNDSYDCYKEFQDFADARDYFLEKIGEKNEGRK